MAVLSKFASDNLPDLPLHALMSQMSANDRLAAYQVCPRWGHQVLEVNKTLKVSSLTVHICPNDIHYLDRCCTEASKIHTKADEQGNLQLLTSLKKEKEEDKKRKEKEMAIRQRKSVCSSSCLSFLAKVNGTA